MNQGTYIKPTDDDQATKQGSIIFKDSHVRKLKANAITSKIESSPTSINKKFLKKSQTF